MVVSHGGSDNPCETADCTKFHELGEKEGFITVYPWACDLSSWNSDMGENGMDDVGYEAALIRYMIRNYPVDAGRVYLSGFSNGAAQAQATALVHPELVAAICHIDSNWPGYRDAPSDVDYKNVRPFVLGMERKKEYDYRIPVWYTYGSREPSYPIYKKSTQQYQYDLWKMYNNITVKPTPERDNPDPSGCGVPGDKYERLSPSGIHPHHAYDVQRFYTNDPEPKNYYNYVIMLGKAHDVAQLDPSLGWEYVRHYRRNPDGSLSEI
jgi:pimeloyl-ACP methyl ester carboxylesterase